MSPYLLPANDAVSLTSLLAVDDPARRVEHGQLLTTSVDWDAVF